MRLILIVAFFVVLCSNVDSLRIKRRVSSSIYDCPYRYQEVFFTVPVDHFGFTNNDTFQIRYLINDTYWKKDGVNSGPIFFYSGNEAPVEGFANNTGFMWDIAPEYNALLIFAEHRYYGNSMPYGNLSLTEPKYFGYLTTEQVLADYAALLTSFKANVSDARNSPIITFGGSYGGMLSCWFRMKYPNIVAGAIAASAPIFNLVDMHPPVPCEAYNEVVTVDFNNTSVECAETVRKSWGMINSLTETANGKDWLSANWKLCDNLVSSDNVTTLTDWLSNVWFYFAMVDYPYPTNFIEPLPGYPIKEVCKLMPDSSADNKTLLMNIFDALNLYFNYTGNIQCMDITNAGSTDPIDSNIANDIQGCTEMFAPICSDGIHDFFEPDPWNLNDQVISCMSDYGVVPRPMMDEIAYGGRNLQAASNIVFSNGLLDPWHPGGVLKSISSSLVAVIIPEGAHHLDLRASNPADPISVIEARNVERMYIEKWVKEEKEYYKSVKYLQK